MELEKGVRGQRGSSDLQALPDHQPFTLFPNVKLPHRSTVYKRVCVFVCVCVKGFTSGTTQASLKLAITVSGRDLRLVSPESENLGSNPSYMSAL